jgi:hypothetical protein
MIIEDNNIGHLIIKNILMAKHTDGIPRNHHCWLGDDVDDTGVYLMVDGVGEPIKICSAPYGRKLWEAFDAWTMEADETFGIHAVPFLTTHDCGL